MAHWTIAFFYVHGWTVCRGRMDAQERRMSMDGRYAAGAWMRRSGECPWMDGMLRAHGCAGAANVHGWRSYVIHDSLMR